MRIIIQRVKEASVEIHQSMVGQIKHGYVILVGIHDSDTKAIVERMAKKVRSLRIFDDDDGKMNESILDKQGSVLSISQFTLFADARKGNRPSFTEAGKPEYSKELYLYFNESLRALGIPVEEGEFGAEMQVRLQNDGPVTLYIDSQEMPWGK